MPSKAVAALRATATAVVLAGCGLGLGPGPGTNDVTLTVTRAFGSIPVAGLTVRRVPGSETVMRMLQRHLNVATRFGGGFVESIQGRSGTSDKVDWFYYVNGVEAPMGAAATAVHQGDRIWWDLHDWSSTQSIPAVVGSFPEPFEHGIAGKRYPVTVECANDVSAACSTVSKELTALKVPFASQVIGGTPGTDSLVLEVGTWRDLTGEVVAQLIDNGPKASGVYAQFKDGGSTLSLLNPQGQTVRRLGAGAGLVAASAQGSSPPTWLITGTNPAGVSAAAHALNPSTLHDHFALAVQGSTTLPIPLNPTS
jgi:hypothetical protein